MKAHLITKQEIYNLQWIAQVADIISCSRVIEDNEDGDWIQSFTNLQIKVKKQPGTCPKCGSDNIEALWTDLGVCCLLCLNCEETWTESHEEI